MSESITKAAHKFLAMGVAVIPVGSDKKPLIAWKNYQEQLPTAEEIDGWDKRFGDRMQLAIVTGKISDLIVIDVEHGGRVYAAYRCGRASSRVTICRGGGARP
ncbi:MAG: hypothetical protein JW384_01034 [Nitrosomonadaceae bacterium]|nr:hypothetical protein [Nitrosomonadaceae bacterium]